jgi:hypothetical protein
MINCQTAGADWLFDNCRFLFPDSDCRSTVALLMKSIGLSLSCLYLCDQFKRPVPGNSSVNRTVETILCLHSLQLAERQKRINEWTGSVLSLFFFFSSEDPPSQNDARLVDRQRLIGPMNSKYDFQSPKQGYPLHLPPPWQLVCIYPSFFLLMPCF